MPFEVPHRERCPFCENVAGRNECAVVEELPDTFAFVLPKQFRPGHVLVIPKRHAATLLDLLPDEAAAVARQVHRIARAIRDALDPSDLNVFQNNGIGAGESIGPYHVHLLPSYPGDQPGFFLKSDERQLTPFEERSRLAARIAAHLPPLA